MASQPQSFHPQPDPEVAAKLEEMGLVSDDLRLAVENANAEALECTSNDVVSHAGHLRWAKPLRTLGDLYASRGFTRERPDKLELLVSPERTFAVTMAPGNSHTGTDKMPMTRIDRGPLTVQAIKGNRHQLRLDGMTPKTPDGRSWKIWLLLSYYDEMEEEIRLELSLPVEFLQKEKSKRAFVTAFEPRLILPPISLISSVDVRRDDEGNHDQIDVPVARRQ